MHRVASHFNRRLLAAGMLTLGWLPLSVYADQPPTGEQIDFFERNIRPVLVEHCYRCHSGDAHAAGKLRGGLLLDTRVGVLTGGDSGPSVIPGDVDGSPLIQAMRYGEDTYQMPPAGKLPASVIADFEKWVAMGAPDPREGESSPATKSEIDWEAARRFWSLQAPQRSEPPTVERQDWVRQPIDAFILARIEAAGLQPAPFADRTVLLRRACFDLTGLPPTLDQQQRFLNDTRPDAYNRLIEELLASPHYGERWGRHWLDVARYAEDNTNMGPFNGPYHHAWRYRDWVIQAFNDDVPYDQFIIRQLATDFLPETGPEDHAALGFQGLAPSYHKEVALAKVALENRYADEWEDRVDAIGQGLLGLTLACARCHDHKYDPVTVEDYYALAGVFASCRQTTRPIISPEEIARSQPSRDAAAAIEEKISAWEAENKKLSKEVTELQKQLKERNEQEKAAGGPLPAVARTPAEVKAKPDFQPFNPSTASARIAEAKQALAQNNISLAQSRVDVAEFKATPGYEVPVADALTEEQVRVEEISKERMKIVYYPDKPRDLNILIRGDASRLGPVVRRRFLKVLDPLVTRADSPGAPPLETAGIQDASAEQAAAAKPEEVHYFTNGSGRLELARAIANRNNPLTARVIVNRVWAQHFGTGLVDTPSNFGVTGNKPSHPELLDDLAVRFMENGWSLKWLHREIMLSATFQQQNSASDPQLAERVDPANRLLSHMSRRRLGAEAFRDSVLAVSGQLDLTAGGPSGDADEPAFHRRAVYAGVSRHKLSDTLQTFDFPDPAIHCAKRAFTTTPLQQMFVLNSPFMQQQSKALAQRLLREAGSTPDEQIDYTYRLVFGRSPSAVEVEIGRQVLPAADAQLDDKDRLAAWQRYSHALLSSNEFYFVD